MNQDNKELGKVFSIDDTKVRSHLDNMGQIRKKEK